MVLKNHLQLICIIVVMIAGLIGCADKKDTASSCLKKLDAEMYQEVAENTNCSDYHRASGYLGQAGMSFSNFMKKGATDNLTKTLTISKLDNASDYTTGYRNYLTKALCLVGPDNLTSSSRCTGLTGTGTRGVPEKEISLFGLIGDLIYVNYGILDNDSNGVISKTETQSFSSMESSATNTIYTDNITYEIIVGSVVYIASDNFTSSPSTSSLKITLPSPLVLVVVPNFRIFVMVVLKSFLSEYAFV